MSRTGFKCENCKSRDTRIHIYEQDDNKLIYYRCKNCGFMWDKGEYAIKLEE